MNIYWRDPAIRSFKTWEEILEDTTLQPWTPHVAVAEELSSQLIGQVQTSWVVAGTFLASIYGDPDLQKCNMASEYTMIVKISNSRLWKMVGEPPVGTGLPWLGRINIHLTQESFNGIGNFPVTPN